MSFVTHNVGAVWRSVCMRKASHTSELLYSSVYTLWTYSFSALSRTSKKNFCLHALQTAGWLRSLPRWLSRAISNNGWPHDGHEIAKLFPWGSAGISSPNSFIIRKLVIFIVFNHYWIKSGKKTGDCLIILDRNCFWVKEISTIVKLDVFYGG